VAGSFAEMVTGGRYAIYCVCGRLDSRVFRLWDRKWTWGGRGSARGCRRERQLVRCSPCC